jgi:hypothetical protein
MYIHTIFYVYYVNCVGGNFADFRQFYRKSVVINYILTKINTVI